MQSRIIWNWQRDVPLKTLSNLKRSQGVFFRFSGVPGQSALKLFFYGAFAQQNRQFAESSGRKPQETGFLHMF
jgi:hypothetical protein